ncbi:MAG: protein TonB [Paraglaciecola sp.]|jgi:protein TonB
MKSQIIKLISFLPITLATCASANNFADVKLTHIKPKKSDAKWISVKQVTPMYPIEFAMKGVMGFGVFKVTVDENGETGEVELISSLPKKLVYKPAKKVIKKWKWQNVSGQPDAIEEKIVRLDFCMGGKTAAQAKARYEEQAKFQCST